MVASEAATESSKVLGVFVEQMPSAQVSHWGGQPSTPAVQQALPEMHLFPHRFPPRQVNPHTRPLQVALPPSGASHGSHRLPQLATSVSATQLSSRHR